MLVWVWIQSIHKLCLYQVLLFWLVEPFHWHLASQTLPSYPSQVSFMHLLHICVCIFFSVSLVALSILQISIFTTWQKCILWKMSWSFHQNIYSVLQDSPLSLFIYLFIDVMILQQWCNSLKGSIHFCRKNICNQRYPQCHVICFLVFVFQSWNRKMSCGSYKNRLLPWKKHKKRRRLKFTLVETASTFQAEK